MARSQEELKNSAWAAARKAVDEKTLIVQWSGGRDSQAIAEVLAEMPEVVSGELKLLLVWVDTGDAPQETIDRFASWKDRATCTRVQSDSKKYRETLGDVVDVSVSYFNGEVPEVSSFQCCYMNISAPMQNALTRMGVNQVIRGTRAVDNVPWARRTEQGVHTIHNIIWDWTTEEVESVIKDMPSFYSFGATSGVDCMSCTGWVRHNSIGYVRAKNPALADAVIEKVRGSTQKVLTALDEYPQDFK